MTISELFETATEEVLIADIARINSHALWMADIILRLPKDPGFKKLSTGFREEIEALVTSVE